MSRHRAHADGTPTDETLLYYRQRASAGLIISEGIYPQEMGKGYMFTPGLTSAVQEQAWLKITDAVHEEGGSIFAQLMHVGRLSDRLLLPGGAAPLAPSAVRPDPNARHYTRNAPRAQRLYETPKAMSVDEIEQVIGQFYECAERSVRAGFDGVELHAASGYLPMQFLTPNTNLRSDRYGGDIAGRSRFVLQCVDAMAAAIGSSRVAIKISPGLVFNDVFDSDPNATYSYLAGELDKRGIAYLQVGSFGMDWDVYGTIRPLFSGPIIGVGGLNGDKAAEEIRAGRLDLAAFGRSYISNPDLVSRIANGWPLRAPDRATYYSQGDDGYTTYLPYNPALGLDEANILQGPMAVGANVVS